MNQYYRGFYSRHSLSSPHSSVFFPPIFFLLPHPSPSIHLLCRLLEDFNRLFLFCEAPINGHSIGIGPDFTVSLLVVAVRQLMPMLKLE